MDIINDRRALHAIPELELDPGKNKRRPMEASGPWIRLRKKDPTGPFFSDKRGQSGRVE